MGDDESDDSSPDSGGTTTDFSGSDTFNPPPDSSAPTDQNSSAPYTPPGAALSSTSTDANLAAAIAAAGDVAGQSFPSDASLGQPTGGADDSTSAIGASSNNAQAGITQGAATAGTGAAPANAPQPESMVSKIGGGLLALAKSPGGGTVLGSILQGMAAGKAQEAALKDKHFYSAPFSTSDFNNIMAGSQTAAAAPAGYLQRARAVGSFLTNGPQPTVSAPTAAPPARYGGF